MIVSLELDGFRQFAEFGSMACAYVEAFHNQFKHRGPKALAATSKMWDERTLRYEGFLIGYMSAHRVAYPGDHQELAMRKILEAINLKESE